MNSRCPEYREGASHGADDRGESLSTMRHCLREPISDIFRAAEMLDRAVDAHVAGDHAEAAKLIAETNMDSIRDWTDSLWGSTDPAIHRVREVRGAPPVLAEEDRIPVRMPNAEERRRLIGRDGYHCRFCGIPVIRLEVRNALRKVYGEALPWPTRGKGCDKYKHAAFQCMWLQYDHITPHSRGGGNGLDNLVVTCAPCNFGRLSWVLEELGLEHPLSHGPVQSSWDGLERFETGR